MTLSRWDNQAGPPLVRDGQGPAPGLLAPRGRACGSSTRRGSAPRSRRLSASTPMSCPPGRPTRWPPAGAPTPRWPTCGRPGTAAGTDVQGHLQRHLPAQRRPPGQRGPGRRRAQPGWDDPPHVHRPGPVRGVHLLAGRPGRAEGHAAFAAPGYGPAPITAPFYVYAANGREYRHWLKADTGYRRSIWACRPLGANARTSLPGNAATASSTIAQLLTATTHRCKPVGRAPLCPTELSAEGVGAEHPGARLLATGTRVRRSLG